MSVMRYSGAPVANREDERKPAPAKPAAPTPAAKPTPKPAAQTAPEVTAMSTHQNAIDRAQAHADMTQTRKGKARADMADRMTERTKESGSAKEAREEMARRLRGEK